MTERNLKEPVFAEVYLFVVFEIVLYDMSGTLRRDIS